MTLSDMRRPPAAVAAIRADTEALGFAFASEPHVGALLAVLAASKPGGRLLELGTGTGHGTAWIQAGMDARARLDTVDTDAGVVAVAQQHLGADPRITFHLVDAATFITAARPGRFDLIYADAWPGKFSHLNDALGLLRVGGVYLIDDLLPQASWPAEHAPKVQALIDTLEHRPDMNTVDLEWASGVMMVVRTSPA